MGDTMMDAVKSCTNGMDFDMKLVSFGFGCIQEMSEYFANSETSSYIFKHFCNTRNCKDCRTAFWNEQVDEIRLILEKAKEAAHKEAIENDKTV